MSLSEMVNKTRLEFLRNAITPEGEYVNRARNYFMNIYDEKLDSRKYYLLKWETREWMSAGSRVPEIGPGPGRTLSEEVYLYYVEPYRATILFGLAKNDIIYYITYGQFKIMSERYLQDYSSEWVRVVSWKALKRWRAVNGNGV